MVRYEVFAFLFELVTAAVLGQIRAVAQGIDHVDIPEGLDHGPHLTGRVELEAVTEISPILVDLTTPNP
ncbi:hypothetical protein ES703_77480 [subsurface metagenome]